MKTVLGCVRKADEDFHMIDEGDRIAVGISGGKDSLLLLYALSLYRRFCKHHFELTAVTLTMGLEPFDLSGIQALCDRLEIEYVIRKTEIAKIVFEERKEKNPCSLCSKMRRGALTDLCNELGIKKLALGHHRDDAEETLLMSLFYEGRLHTFHPVTYLSRSGITQIRPLVYVSEGHISNLVKKLELPVVKSPCPADGATAREDIKELIYMIETRFPNAKEYMLQALRDEEQYGLWNKPKD